MAPINAPATLHRAYRVGVVAAAVALFATVSVATAGNGTGGTSSGGDSGLASNGVTGVSPATLDPGAGGSPAAGGATSGGAATPGATGGTSTGGAAGPGSSGGGQVGGGTPAIGGGGASTAPNPPGAAANDQGVSQSAIDVGFVYVPDSFYQQYGVTPQHEDDIIRAFVKYVNAHGGVHGRAINPVTIADGNEPVATGGDQACRSLVNDSHVFMIVDQGQIGVSDCAVRTQRPDVTFGTTSFIAITASQLAAGSPYLWEIAPPVETQVEQWVEWLAHVKKAQADKIGVIYVDVPYGHVADNGFEAGASRLGLNVVSHFAFSIDPSQVGTECPTYANEFRTKGVTKVAFIGGALAEGVFATCLSNQGLHLTYTFSAVGAAARTDYGDFFPPTFVGSDGTSFEHSSRAQNPQQQTCSAALTSNETAGEGYGTVGMEYCEMIFLTWKALSQINPATGYTTAAFANSMASITDFPANDTDALSFSASNHAGSGTSLVLQYAGRSDFEERSGYQRSF